MHLVFDADIRCGTIVVVRDVPVTPHAIASLVHDASSSESASKPAVLDVIKRNVRPHECRRRFADDAARCRIDALLLRRQAIDAVIGLAVPRRDGHTSSVVRAVAVGEFVAEFLVRRVQRSNALGIDAALAVRELHDDALVVAVMNPLHFDDDVRCGTAVVKHYTLVVGRALKTVWNLRPAHVARESIVLYLVQRRSRKHKQRRARRNELRQLQISRTIRGCRPRGGKVHKLFVVLVRDSPVRRNVHEVRGHGTIKRIKRLQRLHVNAVLAVRELHAHGLRQSAVNDAEVAEYLLNRIRRRIVSDIVQRNDSTLAIEVPTEHLRGQLVAFIELRLYLRKRKAFERKARRRRHGDQAALRIFWIKVAHRPYGLRVTSRTRPRRQRRCYADCCRQDGGFPSQFAHFHFSVFLSVFTRVGGLVEIVCLEFEVQRQKHARRLVAHVARQVAFESVKCNV